MGPTGCSEMSVRNYHYSLRSNPEERSSHLLRGGGLKSYLFYELCGEKEQILQCHSAVVIFVSLRNDIGFTKHVN